MNLNGIGFKNGMITLDEPDAVYYPAQTISGKIEFELHQPLTCSAINILYRGEANVSWSEQQVEKYSGVKRYINVEYKANEEYFNFAQCLYGGNGMSILQPGPYSIPFSYQIPYTAPSSYESTIGNVSYKITAYLECPPVMREELVKTFEIVAPLDLNLDTTGDIKRPINMEFEEVYSCCCSSQPITIGINLPVSGYCPGQAMPITIDVKNDSDMEISKMRFQLVMKERYRSRIPVSEFEPPEKVLATTKKGAVMGKTRRQYQCDLQVPEMLAPNLDNCGIIDVGYFFKVIIKLPGCMDDIEDESEVYIGMIPLEITTGGSAYSHPLKHRLPRGAPPQLRLPYANIGQTNLITHIPLHSPQLNQNSNSITLHQASSQGYPYPNQYQIVPSAPLESSPQSIDPIPIISPQPSLMGAQISNFQPTPVKVIITSPQQSSMGAQITSPQPSSMEAQITSPQPSPMEAQITSPQPSPMGAQITSPQPSSMEAQITSPQPSPMGAQITSPQPSPMGAQITNPQPSPMGAQISSPQPSPIGAQITSPQRSSVGAQITSPQSSQMGAKITSPQRSPMGAQITSPQPSPMGAQITTSQPSPIGAQITSPQPSPKGAQNTSPQPSSMGSQITYPQPSPMGVIITSPHTINSKQFLNQASPLRTSQNSLTETCPEGNKPYVIGFNV